MVQSRSPIYVFTALRLPYFEQVARIELASKAWRALTLTIVLHLRLHFLSSYSANRLYFLTCMCSTNRLPWNGTELNCRLRPLQGRTLPLSYQSFLGSGVSLLLTIPEIISDILYVAQIR